MLSIFFVINYLCWQLSMLSFLHDFHFICFLYYLLPILFAENFWCCPFALISFSLLSFVFPSYYHCLHFLCNQFNSLPVIFPNNYRSLSVYYLFFFWIPTLVSIHHLIYALSSLFIIFASLFYYRYSMGHILVIQRYFASSNMRQQIII